MRLSTCLCLLLALTACAEDAATTDPDPRPDEAARADALVFATATDDAYALVRLAGARAAPFGATIPRVAGEELEGVWARADGRVALVALRRADDPGGRRLLMGDGEAWWPIGPAESDPTLFGYTVAPDLTQVWIDHRVGEGDARQRRSVLRDAAGDILFDTGAPGPWDTTPRLITFAPAGAGGWFVTFDDDQHLTWRDATGDHRVLRSYPSVEGVFRNLLVYATFADSLILWEDHPALSWIDLHGDPHPVEGFLGDRTQMAGLLQVRDGVLERIDGDGVTPVMPWPAGLDPDGALPDPEGRWALVGASDHLRLVDAAGHEVDAFAPAPSTRDGRLVLGPGAERFVAVTAIRVTAGAQPTVFAAARHDLFAGDVIDTAEVTYEVWRPFAGETTRVRSFAPDDAPLVAPRLTPDGATVVWLEAGAAQRLDLATLEVTPVDLGAPALEVGVRVP